MLMQHLTNLNLTRRLLWFLSLLVLHSAHVNAQTTAITGTIRDADGSPISGVTVTVKNYAAVTSTDEQGRFSIEGIAPPITLVFSSVGYQTIERAITSTSPLSIVLQTEDGLLDEVLVVGYGTQRRQSMTGAVAQISGTELQQVPVGNISTMLAGRLPGINALQNSGQPGSDDAALLIRGIGTTGNSSPMILVDGVPRSFNQFDPNEIESVTILKDAAATAVYGMQAANGVILVTTKKGKEGRATVNYTSSVAMNENTRFPRFMDGPEYAYYYNLATQMDNPNTPLKFTEEMVRKMIEGDPEGRFGNTNWLEKIFQTGWTQHHNVSIDGGNDRTKYFVSAGMFDQSGNIDKFDFKRYNIRTNIDTKIGQHLDIGLNVAGRREIRDSPVFGAGKNAYMSIPMQAIRMHPFLPETYEGIPVGSSVNPSAMNPIAARDLSGSSNSQMSVLLSSLTARLSIPWVEGLSVSTIVSYDHDYTFGKVFRTPYQLAIANISSLPSGTINYNVGNFIGINETNLQESAGQASRFTGQYFANYARTFGLHDVTAMFVYEHSERRSNAFSVTGVGFPLGPNDIPELDRSESTPPGSRGFTGSSNIMPRAGYVGRATYAYDTKYLLEVSGRYDGSYKFAPDKRWDFFPAVSVGWRLTQEDFFRQNESLGFVNELKIRGSWGRLGNDANVGAHNYLGYVTPSAAAAVVIGGVPQQMVFAGAIPSADMLWEVATTRNIGLETTLWKGLLGIEFDWFYKVTNDILIPQGATFPGSVGGYYPAYINGGKTDVRGFDLVVNHQNNIGEFQYGARLSLNWARSKIIDIETSANIPNWQKQNGLPIGMKDGFIADGLFQSEEEIANSAVVNATTRPGDIRYRDLNGDGRITYDQDRTWIGRSQMPEMVGGLNLTAAWKGIDLSVFFQGAAYSDVALMGFYAGVGWDNTEFTRPFYGGHGNSPIDLVQNSWTPENPDALYPRLTLLSTNNNAFSNTTWIINGAYLRFKNAQIGYTLPYSLKRVGVERLRFNLSGTNLFTWSHNPFLDPEAPDVNNGYYPQQRTFALGVNLTF